MTIEGLQAVLEVQRHAEALEQATRRTTRLWNRGEEYVARDQPAKGGAL